MEHEGPPRCPKNPPFALVQSQMNPLHALPFHSFHIYSTLRFAFFWHIAQRRVVIPPTFRDNLSPSFKGQSEIPWPLKTGSISCSETLVRNYHSALCNIPEERRSQLHCGWSLKSLYLTLLCHLQLGVPSCLFPVGFPLNRVSVSLLRITCHYARPSCPPWLNYTTHISSEAEIM